MPLLRLVMFAELSLGLMFDIRASPCLLLDVYSALIQSSKKGHLSEICLGINKVLVFYFTV